MYGQTMNNDVTLTGGENPLLAGRYQVVRQLGSGGMGSVWLAEDTQLDNKLFAVKMLPSVLVSNKRAYRQLKDEALVAMKLTHPNIVQFRAFEENSGNPFLVMDYIEGQTLDDYLAEKGKLTEDETLKILKPIAAALDYAHGEGVVHRDVKPANIMIRKDGHPYILDFGIAREIQETMTRVTGKLSSGTLLYMSPEQLRGQSPKAVQDVYSFSAMAYECLKGEPPFSHGQIEYQILNEQPERLTGNAAILAAGVMAGLAKKPEDRPATCIGVLDGSVLARRHGSAEVQRQPTSTAYKGYVLNEDGQRTVSLEEGKAAALKMRLEEERKAANLITERSADFHVDDYVVTKDSNASSSWLSRCSIKVFAVCAFISIFMACGYYGYIRYNEHERVKDRAKVAKGPIFEEMEKMMDKEMDKMMDEEKKMMMDEERKERDKMMNNLSAEVSIDKQNLVIREPFLIKAKVKLPKVASVSVGNVSLWLEPRDNASEGSLVGVVTNDTSEAAFREIVCSFKVIFREPFKGVVNFSAFVSYHAQSFTYTKQVSASPVQIDVKDSGVNQFSAMNFHGKGSCGVEDMESFIEYVVQPGDYMAKISKNFNVRVSAIKQLNGLKDDRLRIGQKLKLPKHRVDVAKHEYCNTKTITLPGGATMEMIYVAPGEFMMGSPVSESGRIDDETHHRVILTRGYWLGKYEVTQEQWQSVMRGAPLGFRRGNWPVENISWEDCQKFICKVNTQFNYGARLPTEAEWEYACRAGTTDAYAGFLGSMAWHADNSGSETHAVGKKKPNAWGFYDMHGNVSEWCNDWYGDYTYGLTCDPTGPLTGGSRVLRGGSLFDFARSCRSAWRSWDSPECSLKNYGFRLCCSLPGDLNSH